MADTTETPVAARGLTVRMETVAKALDTSGEAMGTAVSDFIAKAMDLTDLGRAIAAEYDRHAGTGDYVPPQEVRQRLTAVLAGLTTVVVRAGDSDADPFTRWQGVLDNPRTVADQVLAAMPGTVFDPAETVLRRLTETLAATTVEVLPMLADVTRATPSTGRITDPAWLAGVLADALGGTR